MAEDEKGFIFPRIDKSRCVECNKCKSVCNYKKELPKTEIISDVYAVINKNSDDLKKSASGGAFAALAKWIIDNNGYVFGCAWDERMDPHHVWCSDYNDVCCLQGSKYVQSDTGFSFRKVKELLNNGVTVLFSGTPCQCDGLRGYLGKEYSNLICVELICHGVPSISFFKNYIHLLETRLHGKIIDCKFRDKRRGWGALLNIIYETSPGIIKHKYLSMEESYYYYYYYRLNMINRATCYNCKYAKKERLSDFTIGDYWGANKAHPRLNTDNGVSVLMVNTEKAKDILPLIKDYLHLTSSTFESASKYNEQLKSPLICKDSNVQLWSVYLNGGAEALDKYYRKKYRKKIIIGKIKRHIPIKLKLIIRNIFN